MEKNRNKSITILLWLVILLLGIIIVQNIFAPKRQQARDIDSAKSDWAKLLLVLETMDKDYVDSVDHAKVTEDILPLIMSELDPHSVYFKPEELKDAEESLQGGFDGIGIQFNVPNDTAIVANVIVGGPSEKVGLMAGDRIIKVDDKVIAGVGFPQDSMVMLMKGMKGTKVKISVMRDGDPKLVEFDIIRDKIPVNSVDVAFMINDTTGYIKLSKFARTSYFEVLESAIKLRAEGMRKLIFDLRDNTGGFLDQALLLSNEFLPKGALVFYMEGKNRPREEFVADGHGTCKDIELAVLINESSASSSEIFAGAMQDNDRATIYGLRSFGKGLVQEPFYFSDGSGIRLTIARYYTPTGRSIQKPYGSDEDYYGDIYQRYISGEMMSRDSIKVNDSLKYVTPKGKIVYGGGGIIPDVFIPLDTTGASEYLINCNRQSLQTRFATKIVDQHRAQTREIKDMASLERFLNSMDLKSEFIAFTKSYGFTPTASDWAVSGDIIMTQIKALIGRYTPMDDQAFYPIYLKIDNTVQAAISGKTN